jgi:hypothetical protein
MKPKVKISLIFIFVIFLLGCTTPQQKAVPEAQEVSRPQSM